MQADTASSTKKDSSVYRYNDGLLMQLQILEFVFIKVGTFLICKLKKISRFYLQEKQEKLLYSVELDARYF